MQIRQSSDQVFENLVATSVIVFVATLVRNPILAQALGVLFGGLALLGATFVGLLVFIVRRRPKESGQRFGMDWIQSNSNHL